MGVFRAHAWLKDRIADPCPLPLFVKIDKRESADEEKENYRRYAEHYIPFHLRPNLDRRRCVGMRSCAALVGDFVDDALPLRQSLRCGHGIGALFSLFETTLRAFRLQPFMANAQPMANVLADFVKNRARVHELFDVTIKRARTLGLTSALENLQQQVSNLAAPLSCFVGPSHGDLHTGNIMVRGGDAILIDFSSTNNTVPLTADPAALEVSLMFGTDEADTQECFEEWRAFIDEIYAPINLTLHPSALFERTPGAFSWLRRSLRELRHIILGCNAKEDEAKIVLAAYLLRYARLGLEHLPATLKDLAFDRHAYALVVAERIVQTFPIPDITKGSA
jgi:hypothetical protein